MGKKEFVCVDTRTDDGGTNEIRGARWVTDVAFVNDRVRRQWLSISSV